MTFAAKRATHLFVFFTRVACFSFLAFAGCGRSEEQRPLSPPPVAREPVLPRSEMAAPESEFAIDVQEESFETFIDVHRKGETVPQVHWRPRSKRLSVSWVRGEKLAEHVKALGEMLGKLKDRFGPSVLDATLHAALDYYSYPEYAERLARFASRDERWLKRGGRIEGSRFSLGSALHSYVAHVSEEEMLYFELQEIFAAVGAALRIKGVEKCSTGRPGEKGDIGRWLSSKGVLSRRSVPVGCLMAWFSVEPPH